MTTLLFCTSYARNPQEWELRYRRWVERARRSGLHFDHLAMIDDGSPQPPPWARIIAAGEEAAPAPEGAEDAVVDPDAVELHRFPDNLGRHTILDFPGWYRSFAYSAELGRRLGATRIIHLESDAAFLSREMVAWANAFEEGWAAPWSAMYGFPEMAIQVVAGSALRAYNELFSQPYDWLRDRMHETALPYTHVVRPFVGDRYTGETDVRRDADFLTQIPSAREPGWAWWDAALGDSTPPDAPAPEEPPLFRLNFAADAEGVRRCGFGWAAPEGVFRWTVGSDSWIDLPPAPGATALLLDLGGCVELPAHPFQKLEVHLDGKELGRWKIGRRVRLRVPLPPGGVGAGRLRLHHPDAVAPRTLIPHLVDDRELAIELHAIVAVAEADDATT